MSSPAPTPKELLIASHNAGKISEFKDLLKNFGIEIISAADYRLIEPAETGTTFEQNAEIKSMAAMNTTGLPALADDSGLCVPALDGAPGVYTADWAGHPRDWMAAMQKLQNELGDNPDRRAYFVSVLALSRPNHPTRFFRGQVWGDLVWPVRGALGFGFDPMFKPDGFKHTFAEMPADLKNRISHRARALDALTRNISDIFG